MLKTLIEQASHYFNSMEALRLGQDVGIASLPRVVLLSRLADIFEELHVQRFQSTVWHDKTVNVEMVQTVSLLADIWPHARFLFCTRDAISCVESGLQQFAGATDFEASCKQWAGCHFEWRKQRDMLAIRSFELYQHRLLRDPQGVSWANFSNSRVIEKPPSVSICAMKSGVLKKSAPRAQKTMRRMRRFPQTKSACFYEFAVPKWSMSAIGRRRNWLNR